jgi:hypothetical protein
MRRYTGTTQVTHPMEAFRKLRNFNFVMSFLHALQGVAVVILSRDFSLPISSSFLKFDTATQSLAPATTEIFNLSLPFLIAGFIATSYRQTYEANLAKGMNKARWFEYSLSASVMMVAISLLVGIYDVSSLIMIFGLTACMNLMGLVMEVHNQTTKTTDWLSYWIGCVLGAIPWVVVALYLWTGSANGSSAPTFVYWIFVSIFIFFNTFAINMWLQYKKVGKWKDYLYGEKTYIVLSLVAKSLLAWQVFAGTLRP